MADVARGAGAAERASDQTDLRLPGRPPDRHPAVRGGRRPRRLCDVDDQRHGIRLRLARRRDQAGGLRRRPASPGFPNDSAGSADSPDRDGATQSGSATPAGRRHASSASRTPRSTRSTSSGSTAPSKLQAAHQGGRDAVCTRVAQSLRRVLRDEDQVYHRSTHRGEHGGGHHVRGRAPGLPFWLGPLPPRLATGAPPGAPRSGHRSGPRADGVSDYALQQGTLEEVFARFNADHNLQRRNRNLLAQKQDFLRLDRDTGPDSRSVQPEHVETQSTLRAYMDDQYAIGPPESLAFKCALIASSRNTTPASCPTSLKTGMFNLRTRTRTRLRTRTKSRRAWSTLRPSTSILLSLPLRPLPHQHTSFARHAGGRGQAQQDSSFALSPGHDCPSDYTSCP